MHQDSNTLDPYPILRVVNILLLSPSPEKLLPCILSVEDKIFLSNESLEPKYVEEKQIDVLISYNYRYIIKQDVLESLNSRAYNLHTSLLPLNRGAHPVLWSILERTPLGVTIHKIDKGLDTGPILFQKQLLDPNEHHSLRYVYEMTNQALIELFYQNWLNIKTGKYSLEKQSGPVSSHKSTEANLFLSRLNQSWDTSIMEARLEYIKFLAQK